MMYNRQRVPPMIKAQNASRRCTLLVSLLSILTLRSAGTKASSHPAASLR